MIGDTGGGGRAPVLVGGGQVTVTEGDCPEPLDMLAEAVRRADDDAGGGVVAGADALGVVRILSRRYGDPAAQVAAMVGARPRLTIHTTVGGDSPLALVASLGERIRAGELDVAVVGGAEGWRTRSRCRRAGVPVPWPERDRHAPPGETFGGELPLASAAELALGLALPAQFYPVFEIALRAAAGRSPADHLEHIAGLWSRFSAVAATNPYAAIRRRHAAADIAGVRPGNRMVCYPYTKLLNANDHVDQAAAVILCSAEAAARLRVPRDRWVHLHSAATAADTPAVANRRDLASSPAIAAAGRSAMSAAGIDAGDLEVVDVYSCFPSAVQVAAAALGLDPARPLTVTGGLTFAGGPWNNYTTHALATMLDRLRERPDATGLCTANGGLLTKHAVAVLAAHPPPRPFTLERHHPRLAEAPHRRSVAGYRGPATVESYTVAHARDGAAERAFVACRLADGARTWAATTDPAVMAEMESADVVGRSADVDGPDFYLTG